MSTPQDILFSPLALRNVTLPNRLVRSATYEGWGDPNGAPRPPLASLYGDLARGGVGTIITGFAFISQAGRAMQPGQCGIDADDKIAPWREIVSRVRDADAGTKLFMQIAHAGRQTSRRVTGRPVVGASRRRCTYFRQRVGALDDEGIGAIVDEYATAARRAEEAGFDGVQVHGAHGYLVHQFLSRWTNARRDRWGEPPLFLEEVIRAIRTRCGGMFPVLVKLSASDDRSPGLRIEDTIYAAKRLEELEVDAVEISYGTMEFAMNIFRGACPVNVVLEVNPLFNRIPRWLRGLWKRFGAKRYLKRFMPFRENYNAPAASQIKKATGLPVIVVGGIRSVGGMVACLTAHDLDAVSLCRPLICEPDWPAKIRDGVSDRSRCTNCNLCTVHCDSRQPLRCYQKRREDQ